MLFQKQFKKLTLNLRIITNSHKLNVLIMIKNASLRHKGNIFIHICLYTSIK